MRLYGTTCVSCTTALVRGPDEMALCEDCRGREADAAR